MQRLMRSYNKSVVVIKQYEKYFAVHNIVLVIMKKLIRIERLVSRIKLKNSKLWVGVTRKNYQRVRKNTVR